MSSMKHCRRCVAKLPLRYFRRLTDGYLHSWCSLCERDARYEKGSPGYAKCRAPDPLNAALREWLRNSASPQQKRIAA